MVSFGIFCLVFIVGAICWKLGKSFPILGIIFIALIVLFFYKSCEMYYETEPKKESEEYNSELIEEITEETYERILREEKEKKKREEHEWRLKHGYSYKRPLK